jgi:hypothetical protein
LVSRSQPRIPGANLDFRDEILAQIYDPGVPDPKRELFGPVLQPQQQGPEGQPAGVHPPAPAHPLLRDAPVVCDWNGDGIDDLVVGRGQSQEVLILLGRRQGLAAKRSQKIALDYRTHYETGLFVGDFNGDGRPDLAVFGYTLTGVGWNGPPAEYIWLQPPATKAKPGPDRSGRVHSSQRSKPR